MSEIFLFHFFSQMNETSVPFNSMGPKQELNWPKCWEKWLRYFFGWTKVSLFCKEGTGQIAGRAQRNSWLPITFWGLILFISVMCFLIYFQWISCCIYSLFEFFLFTVCCKSVSWTICCVSLFCKLFLWKVWRPQMAILNWYHLTSWISYPPTTLHM